MSKKFKTAAAAGALLVVGAGGGVALALGGAADASTTSTSTYEGGTKSHPDETPLTGTTADKVKAAALAKYPGATVESLTTDSDGVYEANIVTTAGKHLIVQVGKDFTVTGTQSHGGHGGHGGRGGRGGHHDETVVTGTNASKVKAAVLAKFPGATVERVTTDSSGTYEADVVTTAGKHLDVEVSKAFTVTGSHTEGAGRGHHGGSGTPS